MACLSRLIVGMFAAWLGIAPSLAAPPDRAAAGRRLRVEAFDVEQVPSLAPGTALQFSVFATPGAAATVLIEGVRRLVELREVEPGIYEGAHVIDAGDRLRAGSTRSGDRLARRRGGPRHARGVASARRRTADAGGLAGAGRSAFARPGVARPAAGDRRTGALVGAVPRRQHAAAVQTSPPPVVAQALPLPVPGRLAPVRVPAPAWSTPPPLGFPYVAPPPGGHAAACRDCARVESIRAVEVPTGPAYAGAIAGGIAGAVFGEQIGKAHERHVTRALGAIGGAVLGHEIQRAATSRTLYDAALRLPNGVLRVRRYDAPPPFQVGQLIRLEAAVPRPGPRPRSERHRSTLPAAETSTPLMQLATLATPARATSRRFAAIPSRLEALAVAGAIVLLLPAFAQVADFGSGRDRRFTEAGFRIEGLPAPLLPALCREQAAAAEAAVRERLCPGVAPVASRAESARIPAAIADALGRSSQVFVAPLNRANERLAALRQQQREGAELRAIADAIGSDRGRPASLRRALPARWRRCGRAAAARAARRAGPRRRSTAPDEPAAARANGVLLLAAALDGRHEVESLAGAAALPAAGRRRRPAAQRGLGAGRDRDADGRRPPVGGAGAQERGDARAAADRRLAVGRRRWRLGYLLMLASRRRIDPALGVALSLAVWAAAAWLARVPWPFAGSRGFDPGRIDVAWDSAARDLGAGARRRRRPGAVVALLRRRDPVLDAAAPAQAMSSRIGYAGLVLATGLGWLLLLDLSAHAHRSNRYLALYHQGHLWLGAAGVLAAAVPAPAAGARPRLEPLDRRRGGARRQPAPRRGRRRRGDRRCWRRWPCSASASPSPTCASSPRSSAGSG